jgi:transcriptional regulator with XRE-family HTH domain
MSIEKVRKSKAVKFLEEHTGGPLTLPEFLASIRLGEEMSYQAFASKLGISRSHLCDIEKGRKAVSLDRAIVFAEILGYSKDQFTCLALQSQVKEAGLPYLVRIEAA